MEIIPLLKQFNLSDKEIKIYLALLETGATSVRKLSQKSGINRGTTYDTLKSLKNLGLASYYHKDTKQFFVAEDPEKLQNVLEEKEQAIIQMKKNIQEVIPALKSLYHASGSKPVVKYYEGDRGTKTILQDILDTVAKSQDKTYFIFSSSTIRPYMHKAWPGFTEERIKRGVKVKVIAVGHSGTKALLSERKSLSEKEGSPTYILVYEGKVAMISVSRQKELLGLIIEDEALFKTHMQHFKFIWGVL